MDSSDPLTHHDPRDLGLVCVVKKRKIYFRILSDLRIPSWIFFKKRAVNVSSSVGGMKCRKLHYVLLLYLLVSTRAMIGQFSGPYSPVRPTKI